MTPIPNYTHARETARTTPARDTARHHPDDIEAITAATRARRLSLMLYLSGLTAGLDLSPIPNQPSNRAA